ncbi:U6 small nuclear RNA (adenine-(43)-N(6))-methyltransferase-like isoform X2 [Varroa destructor]|uniref:U6 small nuclear RNA (adenine-(43)-N(6))-methyltransferase n=1 Tax=Varroa destructor TaxID=109461 RepID=A0A7M7KGC2_VARDE|nr:U6 small nuclear RNA (adenine-(43)-N(6))-methyltransferase-like isoform X2 [Varroa destructor]
MVETVAAAPIASGATGAIPTGLPDVAKWFDLRFVLKVLYAQDKMPPKRSSPKKLPARQNLNNFMHHRNVYFNNPPDFSRLALEFEEFRKISTVGLNGKVSVDFSQPATMRILSRCLLKSDFDLDVYIPQGFLAPTVPQRLNYLLWCEDIVSLALGKTHSVRAVDFGTGSSCVLPLLGVRQCSWRFTAVEANLDAFNFAKDNIERNQLKDFISLIKTSEGKIHFDEFLQENDTFDILLCNPPFYKDSWESDAFSKADVQGRPLPKSDCDGTEDEKITTGGEFQFVMSIFEQSLLHKEHIRVVTAMLGKKKDLKQMTKFLQDRNVQYTTTEFCQGKTMRWGLAWSHSEDVKLALTPQMKHVTPKPPMVFDLPKFIPGVKYTTEAVCTRLKELLANVQVKFIPITEGKHNCHLWVLAEKNTLAGQRRRRRERERKSSRNAIVSKVPSELLHEAAKAVKIKSTEMIVCETSHFQRSKRTRSSDEEAVEDNDDDLPSIGSSPMDCKSLENGEAPSKRSFVYRDDISEYFLNCDVRVRRTASGLIIQLQNRDPRQDRDSLCQLQQYLKNNLCSQPKELALTLKMVV